MNIQDLQQQWNEHGNQDDLVTKLFKESRHLKIDILLKRNILNSILFVLLNLIINIYVWSVLIFNFDNISARYIGILLLILTYVVLFKNIRQLDLIYKINNSKPVVETQKLIGKLKVERVRHNRFIFVFSNLFFWSVIILIYKWDLALLIPYLWEEASIVVIIHVGFSIIWLPLSIWILNKYDEEKYKNAQDQYEHTSLNDALSYLKEIEDFVN